MNQRIKFWFENGKVVEALCGDGDYFIPDHTYRDQHADLLVVGQLLEWAAQGHAEQAAKGFEATVIKLFKEERFQAALGLLLCYGIIKKDSGKSLAIDESNLESLAEQVVHKNGDRFSKDTSLRNLLLQVISYFPDLGKKLGMTKINKPADIAASFKA